MRVQDRTPQRLGPYRLIRRLGEGGMGVVYLAEDGHKQLVALKALHPGMAQEGNARRRLAREVETMHRIASPYVAEVLGADLTCDPPYIVTRYVPGLTLDAVVSAGGPLTGEPLARLARGLAQALAATHAAGVVHRDLKPGNVMICDSNPVVIDFGIAQVPDTTRLTMTGMFMGTPGYLAPEVIEGKESGPASDVHSWGATVAYAATGRPPYGSGTFEAIFFRIMHGQPDLTSLPGPLLPLVLRALSRDPAARPSAAELASWCASLDPGQLAPTEIPDAGGAVPLGPGAAGFGKPGPGAVGAFGIAGGVGVDGALGGVGAGAGGAVAVGPGWTEVAGGAGLAGGADGLGGGGSTARAGGLPRTIGDQPIWRRRRSSTKPLNQVSPEEVRDLLPPVYYQPTTGVPGGGQAAGGLAPSWQHGSAAGVVGLGGAGGTQQAGPAGAVGPGLFGRAGRSRDDGRTVKPVSSWSPLVLAFVATLVAVSVFAPFVGTAIALAVLMALRAASIVGSRIARRRTGASGGPVSSFVAVGLYPLALVRALFVMLLLAPVAILAFAVAAAATIIIVPSHPLPQALAFGAGAVVTIMGIGPGSRASRGALAKFFTAVGGSPGRLSVTYAGVLAVAVVAVINAWSKPAAFWPIGNLHGQLVHWPALQTVLTDIRKSLVSLAHRIGL